MVAAAAGRSEAHRTSIRRLYCHVAKAVPQTDALLLVPNSVAGVVVGYAANKAGNKMRPPPPTIESTKPANAEAKVVKKSSMRGLWWQIWCSPKAKGTGVTGAFLGVTLLRKRLLCLSPQTLVITARGAVSSAMTVSVALRSFA